MAADGMDFTKTFVVKNNEVIGGEVVAIGLYGSDLKVGYSSKGGWNSFGLERKVTNLSLRVNEDSEPLVRAMLSIDEENQSLIFGGNMPEGSFIRLMKANIDRLITGAEGSAIQTKEFIEEEPEFALLVSCMGRRVVLKQLVEEEVEAVREVLGDKPVISGFYSYGELAPFGKSQTCLMHNQTMTITTFSEG